MSGGTKDYFDFHYEVTKWYLLIPPDNTFLKFLYFVILGPHLVLLSLSVILESIMIFLGGSGDFSDDVLLLAVIMFHGMAINRVVRWVFIKTDYDQVLKKLRQINLDLSNFDYDPRPLHLPTISGLQKGDEIRNYHARILEQAVTQSKRVTVAFLFYINLNISVSYIMNYYGRPVEERWNAALNKTSLYRDYPYQLWYPFDTSISDGYYWIGFLYQPYAFYFVMCGFFCIDDLCVSTIIHLTAFVKVLGEAIACLDKNVDPTLTEAEVLELKKDRLIKCIDQIKHIFQCGDMLNKVFSSQLLLQEVCMSGGVCCSIYRVTSAPTTMVEMGYISTMGIVAVIQLFKVSWFNQCFTMEVFELLHSIYELDWLSYNMRMRKMLVFLLQRIQKPFYFTMGLGYPLDIKVFLTMIKTSYSFYTLLSRTRSNESDLNKA